MSWRLSEISFMSVHLYTVYLIAMIHWAQDTVLAKQLRSEIYNSHVLMHHVVC